ncbi:MAG TPA: hypothetical protein VKA38_12795, partial [Draconibacterium sp.]|nr:hypothetical protein [Draconibacterium sp.]
MIFKKYLYVLLILFLLFSFPVFSQPGKPAMDKLATRFDSLVKNKPQELVYLQTSKDIYETGEDLWFKAYMLNTQTFIPSVLSQTFYLQMVKEKTGTAVWQEKYEISNGFACGQVFLQDTLSEGDYLLEAFTAHSFYNDSSEFKAIRRITVKKDMKPRPSFAADFDKVRYKTGDSIKVTITSLSEDHKSLYAEITADLLQGNNNLGQAHSVTNRQGKSILAFVLQGPDEGLRVNATIKYKEKEENRNFPVPCKKGSPVQFDVFPESGNLVAGIESKLAFKAINIDGNPLEVKGTFYENDQPLLEFKSVHAGMGSFNFTPEAGKDYHIRLSEPETDSTFVLPEILPEGITIRLTGRDKDYLEFIASQSPGMPKGVVYLRGQMRGTVYCMAGGRLNQELKIKIPLKEFPQQGIAEFTLFNENLVPVAERLVYIHPDRKLYIEAKPDKEKYGTREKATLEIKVTDENGQPVQANLGVSVFDKLYQNPHNPENILTHCYLSAQLKGRIYDPAYYFNEKNKNREEALDLLMLTQGWRKYVWNREALEGQKTIQPIISDGVKGEVHAVQKRKQKQGMQQFVMAFNPGENKKQDLIMADSAGNFTVTPSDLKIYQGGYVYLKPMSSRYKSLINIAEPFDKINNALAAKNIIYPIANLNETKEKNTRPYVVGPNIIELGEVIIEGKGKQVFRDKYMGQLDSLAKLDLNDDFICSHPHHVLNCFEHGRDSTSTKPIEGKVYTVLLGKDGKILDETYNKKVFYGQATIKYHYPQFTEEELLKMHNLSRIKAYYGER